MNFQNVTKATMGTTTIQSSMPTPLTTWPFVRP
jgi:hypothetical protein